MNAIQTFDLTKKFNSLIAVDGIDLEIKEGELFSLLGPNGAGKTTTIKMLCCLLKPTSGTASIMGYDIAREPFKIKELIGWTVVLFAAGIVLFRRSMART